MLLLQGHESQFIGLNATKSTNQLSTHGTMM